MANYYTNFSFIVTLADEAERAYALELFRQLGVVHQGDVVPADFPTALKNIAEDAVFELDPGSEPQELWFHSGSGGIDAVCAFVQHLLQRFQPTTVVTFEWSHDCTAPRTDAFGGGAAIVTADEIKSISTSDWVRNQTQVAAHQPST